MNGGTDKKCSILPFIIIALLALFALWYISRHETTPNPIMTNETEEFRPYGRYHHHHHPYRHYGGYRYPYNYYRYPYYNYYRYPYYRYPY